MQSVSSRIWTRAAMSIFYDDNHYTTGTSIKHLRKLYGLFNAEVILIEEQYWYYLTNSLLGKGFIVFARISVRKWTL